LFVAIKGDTHDGHDFVGKAFEAGAAAALVSEAYHAAHGGQNLIVVLDTLKALEDLARAARTRAQGEIIAVTGSAGKTTTKEAIRTVLSAYGQTHASLKSFNNHWGVPLTLARLPREARFGVFEIGMNHPGEITPLVKLVRPHIAVITTVAPAHLQFFNSVADIAAAKAEIFLGLEPGGTALLNADHDYLHILFNHARKAGVGRVVTYGFDESADWRITDIEPLPTRTIAQVVHEGETYGLSLAVPGRHMMLNAVAALAVARLSGEGTAAAINALAQFSAPEGRGETTRLGPATRPLLLVDESYNANVASMTAALEVYSRVRPPGGQKVLVLGDMLELGAQSAALHAELKDAVLSSGATRIFLVGRSMAALRDVLGEAAVAGHAESIDEIGETILSSLAHGDAVMVKGSKGVRLAGLVQAIRDRFS
ncbi:MAG TPA: UDP-N-acetylmuramoyl-tripeptide--D-alanyl-D-alanine ligase, partial [Alphaproteobacteria bacterium]|nr:UDP-N-acetylmuramoyl-tripeptide--D-alanyl-D-alanine ligase [Alphaproteobacteria bacterium]